jgi:Zn-dependent protease
MRKLFSFSKKEVFDLIKAYAAITLAFAALFTKGSLNVVEAFAISAIAVGAGFIVHELAHKFMAQHYNCKAEFRSDDKMLVLAVLLAIFTSFIIAAPGAVMISNVSKKREYGIISAVGPASNLVLALLFFLLPFGKLSAYGFYINSMLALFNMIPAGNFDGKKVLGWNKSVFGVLMGLSVIFFLIAIL